MSATRSIRFPGGVRILMCAADPKTGRCAGRRRFQPADWSAARASGRIAWRTAAGAVLVSVLGWRTLGFHVEAAAAAAPWWRPPDPLVFVQAPVDPRPDQPAAGLAPPAFPRGARLFVLPPSGPPRRLAPDFYAACDPDVAYDGRRVLFAGKRRAEDPWNIFELELATGRVRQVTRQAGNCRSPRWLPPLFTIDSPKPWRQIAFVSDAAHSRTDDGRSRAFHLYTCRLDGGGLQRLSYTVSGDIDPWLLWDGRILLASWRRSLPHHADLGRVQLCAANADGTDFALLAQDAGPPVRRTPCVTTQGLVVFVESARLTAAAAGRLAAVRLRRPLHSYRRLTGPDDGWCAHPAPGPRGSVLVARRPPKAESFGLWAYEPAAGGWRPILDDPAWDERQPQLVRPRPEPDGRSSVVEEDDPYGKLYCLNARITGQFEPLAGASQVKRIRVLEGCPWPADQPPPQAPGDVQLPPPRRLLAEVDLAPDGSFHLRVPADTPIELQLVDGDGLAHQACSWIWARRHEPRGCIGCHEDGELTPENGFAHAMASPALDAAPPASNRKTITFRRDVAPLIQEKCGPCHRAQGVSPQLVFDPPDPRRAFAALLARPPGGGPAHVLPGAARASPVVWHLLGRNTARPWDGAAARQAAKPMPDDGRVKTLSEDERLLLIRWIDLGAAWDVGRGNPP